MIVVRTVFQAQFGQGGKLAARFVEGYRRYAEEMGPQPGAQGRWRILTDLAGGFDTVVFESEAESLADGDWVGAHGTDGRTAWRK
jgi:hypothetical protein